MYLMFLASTPHHGHQQPACHSKAHNVLTCAGIKTVTNQNDLKDLCVCVCGGVLWCVCVWCGVVCVCACVCLALHGILAWHCLTNQAGNMPPYSVLRPFPLPIAPPLRQLVRHADHPLANAAQRL